MVKAPSCLYLKTWILEKKMVLQKSCEANKNQHQPKCGSGVLTQDRAKNTCCPPNGEPPAEQLRSCPWDTTKHISPRHQVGSLTGTGVSSCSSCNVAFWERAMRENFRCISASTRERFGLWNKRFANKIQMFGFTAKKAQSSCSSYKPTLRKRGSPTELYYLNYLDDSKNTNSILWRKVVFIMIELTSPQKKGIVIQVLQKV